jgi:Type I phosphodiesterase / nucleotide pyrophosphatase
LRIHAQAPVIRLFCEYAGIKCPSARAKASFRCRNEQALYERNRPARPATSRPSELNGRITCIPPEAFGRREITDRAKAHGTLERGYDSKMNAVLIITGVIISAKAIIGSVIKVSSCMVLNNLSALGVLIVVTSAANSIPGMTVEVNGRAYAAPRRPTVVMVVDGFDPAYLEHGIANGTLPTMASFKEHGFVGIADCSMPSTTNTNNTSIVTGVPPAVHGINGNYYLDPETGEEIMITDASRLRCGTILGELSRIGVKTAVVTAKDKLLKILAYKMSGISFSSEYAHNANLANNGVENVEKLVGRPQPDQYSADLSLFVFDAGVKLLSSVKPDLMYLSTSDYVQHKHAPGEPDADAYHQAVDVRGHGRSRDERQVRRRWYGQCHLPGG